jgi:hypothetical protein
MGTDGLKLKLPKEVLVNSIPIISSLNNLQLKKLWMNLMVLWRNFLNNEVVEQLARTVCCATICAPKRKHTCSHSGG